MPSKECAASLRYRTDRLNLHAHVAGHRRSLQHVEDGIFADMAAAAGQHSDGSRDEEALQLAVALSLSEMDAKGAAAAATPPPAAAEQPRPPGWHPLIDDSGPRQCC